MKKLILFPVVLVLKLVRLILNKASQLYAMAGVWSWALVIFGIIYTAIHQNWNQTTLFTIIGIASFGLLFLAVLLESLIEDLENVLLK